MEKALLTPRPWQCPHLECPPDLLPLAHSCHVSLSSGPALVSFLALPVSPRGGGSLGLAHGRPLQMEETKLGPSKRSGACGGREGGSADGL